MRKGCTRLIALTIIVSAMMGGWLAYAQTETRDELHGYDNGTGGENHRIGRKLSAAELAEYDASNSKGQSFETTCKRLDASQDSLMRLMDDFSGEPLGRFKITAYTAGFESCGKLPDDPLYGITATGARVKENHTVASDWNVLPPGTRIRIEGIPHIFTVEDRGGAVRGKHIDIYIEDLEEALEWGVRDREVWLIDS